MFRLARVGLGQTLFVVSNNLSGRLDGSGIPIDSSSISNYFNSFFLSHFLKRGSEKLVPLKERFKKKGDRVEYGIRIRITNVTLLIDITFLISRAQIGERGLRIASM